MCMHNADFQSISSKLEGSATFEDLNSPCKLGRTPLSYLCENGTELGPLTLLVDRLSSLCEEKQFLNRGETLITFIGI